MEIEEMLDDARTMLWQVAAERRKAARYVAAAMLLVAVASLLVALQSKMGSDLTRDAISLRQALDEHARQVAKARHPAGRDTRNGGGERPAPRPRAKAVPVTDEPLPDEDLTTPEHELHREQ